MHTHTGIGHFVDTHTHTTHTLMLTCFFIRGHTHLFPHPGMPTAWMMKITTWQKNTKKKEKKLKELSDLEGESTDVTHSWLNQFNYLV